MTAKTDEELAAKSVNDPEAERELLGRYWNIAGVIARSFPVNGHDFEDVECVALEAVLKAVRTYSPFRGTKFSTWVRQLIGRDLIDLYRKANKQAEIPPAMLANLNDVLSTDGGEEVVLEDAVTVAPLRPEAMVEQIDRSGHVERIHRAIWEPFRDFIGGWSADDICHRHRLTPAAVELVLSSVRSIGRTCLPPELYADLIGLLDANDQQPVLEVVPTRDSEEGSEVAIEVYRRFRDTQRNILGDLAEGHTYSEIAARNGVSEGVVAKLVTAIRAVLAGPSGKAA